jgi:hypothetical protein
MKKFILLASLLLVTNSYSLDKEAWDRINAPENFFNKYENDFDSLPKKGKVRKMPWTDSYWPTYQGGISYRWLTGEVFYNKLGYSPRGSEYLSPAEKFDIYLGREDFPITNYERRRTRVLTNRDIPKWEGLCHNWAPASFLFEEPGPLKVKGKSGDTVHFGASDLKALLILNFEINRMPRTKFLGSRCNLKKEDRGFDSAEECKDTNAGAFHIVLANLVGNDRSSFVIDKTRDQEVWNQPVAAYQTKVLKKHRRASRYAAKGAKKEVEVETVVYWVGEIEPKWNAVGTSLQKSVYRYVLELDRKGRILGGRWLSWERPDFIWLPQGRPRFGGIMSPLKKLYNKATR